MNKTIICLLTIFSLLAGRTASAQSKTSTPTISCEHKLEQKLLTKNNVKSPENLIASEQTISVANITLPSLWWAKQQFDPFGGRLINKWLADSEVKQLNLIVNWQLWSLLDYLGRYRFVNQFGTVARKYGYELNILNHQQQCLASYQRNLESSPPKWEINLEQSDQDSLQIEPLNN